MKKMQTGNITLNSHRDEEVNLVYRKIKRNGIFNKSF